MSLTLYQHPLASFCHKVVMALTERGTPIATVTVDLADAGSSATLRAAWPVGKIPVLHDAAADRWIPETTIIIDYVEQHYPSATPMLPQDPAAQLQARLWDRFFDLYISQPMQKIVIDRIRPPGATDPHGVAEARATLDTAYGMIDALPGPWATGTALTLADCAAAPALFYAAIIHPFRPDQHSLAAYHERLVTRPSYAACIAEARPWFPMFPYAEAIPPRFLADTTGI